MKTIHRPIFNKGYTFERKAAREKWLKLVELLKETDLTIKNESETGNEMFISIPGEDIADIELYFKPEINGEFVHIQLWYYRFNLSALDQKHNEKNHNFKSLHEAMEYINSILRDITFDRKQIPTA
ncbi:hypothetical protein MTW73_11200 [Staphylococcus haemolyticus]|uniref:hypothetical protein n=1 Tax=Staphylococcus haemolyticus TaxID=1283 RepID=UPI001FB1C957|nr:hypothetical protein [Staphylococcus haemolyticus]MCJ0960918.1 hypothetical protein [Staphylococcus haemolyticus]